MTHHLVELVGGHTHFVGFDGLRLVFVHR